MGHVRSFEHEDLPQVERLYRKTFCEGAERPSERLKTYLSEVFLQNPWSDAAIPSLVYVENDEITGFLGVIPRWMVIKGKRFTTAVGSQFMVDPNKRNSWAGARLMKAYLAGPQDLAMTDGANATSRRFWETLEGRAAVPIYSIYWTRVLRPGRHALSQIAERNGGRRSGFITRTLGAVGDMGMSAMEPYRFKKTALPFIGKEETDEGRICEYLSTLSAGVSLHPEYDRGSFKWLLQMAAQKSTFGPLRNEVLRNAHGDVVGWYLYYLNVGGMSQVLQLLAAPKCVSGVLSHLFHSAWRQGSTAISGRMEPRYLHELYHHHCRFRCGSAFLAKSKDPDVLKAVYMGDAVLTRLDGEWWTAFRELAVNG